MVRKPNKTTYKENKYIQKLLKRVVNNILVQRWMCERMSFLYPAETTNVRQTSLLSDVRRVERIILADGNPATTKIKLKKGL